MIIPLNLHNENNSSTPPLPPSLARLGSDEVVLIELQGSLESEGDRSGQPVGQLDMSDPNKPKLTIGHHLLEGKLANLPKPLAVLRRNAPPPSAHARHVLESTTSGSSSPYKPVPTKTDDEQDLETADADNGSFDVVAVVRRKIVFAKRPVPIVGAVHVGSVNITQDFE